VVSTRRRSTAESGGQVGDAGELTSPGVHFTVVDRRRGVLRILTSGALAQGKIRLGDTLIAVVDGSGVGRRR